MAEDLVDRRRFLKKIAALSGAGIAAAVVQQSAEGQDFSNPSDPFSPLNPDSPLHPSKIINTDDSNLTPGQWVAVAGAGVATTAAVGYAAYKLGQNTHTKEDSKKSR